MDNLSETELKKWLFEKGFHGKPLVEKKELTNPENSMLSKDLSLTKQKLAKKEGKKSISTIYFYLAYSNRIEILKIGLIIVLLCAILLVIKLL